MARRRNGRERISFQPHIFSDFALWMPFGDNLMREVKTERDSSAEMVRSLKKKLPRLSSILQENTCANLTLKAQRSRHRTLRRTERAGTDGTVGLR